MPAMGGLLRLKPGTAGDRTFGSVDRYTNSSVDRPFSLKNNADQLFLCAGAATWDSAGGFQGRYAEENGNLQRRLAGAARLRQKKIPDTASRGVSAPWTFISMRYISMRYEIPSPHHRSRSPLPGV